eukprot:Selendium_serpulae@DN3877_c0_g1_i3.p1
MLPTSGSTAPPGNVLGTGTGLHPAGTKGVWAVSRHSESWLFLEYMLMCAIRTSRLRVRQAWQLSPAEVVKRFENRTKGALTLYSWVDCANLDEDNSIQDVCQRGLSFSSRGMRFVFGNFSLPAFPLMNMEDAELQTCARHLGASALDGGGGGGPAKGRSARRLEIDQIAQQMRFLTAERRIYEFLLCEVGVGRGYPVETEAEANGDRFSPPVGFDSAYLKTPSVPAPRQTLALHALPALDDPATPRPADRDADESDDDDDGRAEPDRRATPRRPPKARPGLPKAAVGILPQYTFRHEYVVYDASQVVPRYLVQLEVDPSLPELFAVPLCDYCHEAPASLWCAADTARLCNDCDDVRANYIEGEQRIYSIVEQSMTELQTMSEQKMSTLLADQFEAARQRGQSEWGEQYIAYARSVLPSADFLMAWLRHCRLREEFELLGLDGSRLSELVTADMRLEGRVDILTDA